MTDGNKLTLDTANGKLALNFETGLYDYQAKDVHGDGEDKFLLTLRDGDGDTAETNLDIAVQDLAGGVAAPISLRMAAAPTMTSEIVSDEDTSSQVTHDEMQDELIDFSTLSLAAPRAANCRVSPVRRWRSVSCSIAAIANWMTCWHNWTRQCKVSQRTTGAILTAHLRITACPI